MCRTRIPSQNVRRVVIAVVLAAWLANGARANPENYERSLASSVYIFKMDSEGNKAAGSGLILDTVSRVVLTNFHVVGTDSHVEVFFPAYANGSLITDPGYYEKNHRFLAVTGEVIARDPKRDLAAVRLPWLPAKARALRLASHSPRPGETLYAIGNSGAFKGVLWRYSKGEVRQVFAATLPVSIQPGQGFVIQARVIETQIPSNPGDSGGPVLNERNELVGVTSNRDNSSVLITRAIDISEVRAFLRSVRGSPASSHSPTARAARSAGDDRMAGRSPVGAYRSTRR